VNQPGFRWLDSMAIAPTSTELVFEAGPVQALPARDAGSTYGKLGTCELTAVS